MNNQSLSRKICGVGVSLVMFASLGVVANAQEANVEGTIIGRSGPMMYVSTDTTPRQTVVLSDSTKATEKGGFLGLSHKDHGVADLVPGLEVKIDGTYDQDHQLVAKKVEFSRGAYKTAKQIDAGLHPVNDKIAAQGDQLASDRRDIESGQQNLAGLHQQTDANGQAIGQANQAIGATNGRIGQLDQYDEKGTLTVNFKNGSSVISQKDQDALSDFVKNAASMQGFMIQVQGYASKVGNPKLNQKLSSERADNVLTIIQQSGTVPLTRILAPAAMGTTQQVADNHTRAGQAENRRVVVTILVNKGITSGPDQTAAANPPAAPGQE
jgi:OOP family OmpA-OmpF porin